MEDWENRLEKVVHDLQAGTQTEIEASRLYSFVEPPSQAAFVKLLDRKVEEGALKPLFRVLSLSGRVALEEHERASDVPAEVTERSGDVHDVVPSRDVEIVFRAGLS